MSLVARGSARRRREAEAELLRQQEEDARRRREPGEPEPEVSPFGGSPLGALFDAMLSGSRTRSYEYDDDSGRWVDVPERRPEPPLHDEAGKPQRRQRQAPHRQRQQPQSPLSSLFGGGMMGGDGSGNFEVQPPGELTTFEDVGGMDTLK